MSDDTRQLRERAADVLQRNDAGGWTKAAPRLYPHQWSWDSAFIAIGWAHLDTGRAVAELERLFAAQWSTGMVPHIVFDPATADADYFPGAQHWNCSLSPHAPAAPISTTGLCQPPVHALALLRIWHLTAEPERERMRARLQRLYPKVLAWHRYLATYRDTERSGLVTVYHPWEGTDNSPRWDEALACIEVGDLPAYTRRDTAHVTDVSQRPSDLDYDRYLWLVELLKQYRYDDAEIGRHYPFLIKDVFFSAIFVVANEAMLELAELVGAPEHDREQLADWADRGRRGLSRQVDARLGLCLDHDLRAGAPIRVRTFAGFAELFADTPDDDRRAALLTTLDSPEFAGEPRMRWPLLPSTSPAEPVFEPRNYWRGPVWPVVSWLLWRALRRLGCVQRAEVLRKTALDQVATGGFAEYFEPFTGEPLGSPLQSWTAAVALDWDAEG